MFKIAEMLQDLLGSIYNRISQLRDAITGLKTSLDDLNQTITTKITELNNRFSELSNQMNLIQTEHVKSISFIGQGIVNELGKIQEGLALDSLKNIISNLENFEKVVSEVLNQDTVNLLLSEAIDSVKKIKETYKLEEVTPSG